MSKDELIQLLREYKENKAKLTLRKREQRMIELRLAGDKEIEVTLTTAYGINNDIHSKNTISDKVANSVLKREEQKEEDKERLKDLTKEIDELQEKVDEAEIRLKALKYKEHEILYAYYVEGRTYEDIGNNLYFKLFNQTRDKDTIKNIVEKAAEKMINL